MQWDHGFSFLQPPFLVRVGRFNLGAYFTDGAATPTYRRSSKAHPGVETSNSSTTIWIHRHAQTSLNGGFSGDFDRPPVDSSFTDNNYSGTIDTYNGTAVFSPPKNFIFPSAPIIPII